VRTAHPSTVLCPVYVAVYVIDLRQQRFEVVVFEDWVPGRQVGIREIPFSTLSRWFTRWPAVRAGMTQVMEYRVAGLVYSVHGRDLAGRGSRVLGACLRARHDSRSPGNPEQVVTPAQAGVRIVDFPLDSGMRRNETNRELCRVS
jgi:hypothetical protein